MIDLKKRYIAPEIEIVNQMPGSAILTNSLEHTEDPIQDKDGTEATGAFRGEWGNLWNNK